MTATSSLLSLEPDVCRFKLLPPELLGNGWPLRCSLGSDGGSRVYLPQC
jgi:hypothetical protein